MSVRLDQIPALGVRPARPRSWFWLCVLPLLLLLLGIGGMFLVGARTFHQQPSSFWGLALGGPFLGWCLLSFMRALLYLGQQQVADGWDQAREEDLSRKVRRGRRVQQVLGVSLQTAFHDPCGSSATQLNALLGGVKVLKAQPSRQTQAVIRHSRIAGDEYENSEQALGRIFTQILADLMLSLKQVSDDTPLALLLEVDSVLPQSAWQYAWRWAWRESGIRQSPVPVEGSGLEALDQWLDHRISDQALLLVVAVQFSPLQPDGAAEVAVGLLLGNRLTQTALPTTAYLHRPEQARGTTNDDLLYAVRQALDWVPLEAQSIERTWRAGIDALRDEALSTVLSAVPLPSKDKQDFYNLDTTLGYSGKTSPWLTIAVATQTIQGGAGPQFIFSGGGCVDAGLWSTVLMPVPIALEVGI